MRFFICSLFLANFVNFAFAQTPRETYQMRANQDTDHQWTDSINSERFTVWYSKNAGDCANITEANARTALNELENIFDVYMQEGFAPPYTANATKYKMGVYVLRNGSNCSNAVGTRFCNGTSDCSEGHAFGGTIGNPKGPGMWLSSGAVSDKWALAHEFMHGLQTMAGGMGGGNTNQGTNFRGWFFESHANLMPHLVYPRSTDTENGVHYCAEMYTRTAELYLGSTRNRYCNWQFFEYLIHKSGTKIVNDIWLPPPSGVTNHDPFSEVMRQNNLSQHDFGDLFGDFAMKAVIWDINNGSVHPNPNYAARGSALFRARFNKNLGNPDERFKRPRYTYLEALDNTDGASGRFVSPFAFSPQRYGYNIIRLYPDAATGTVAVRFRGDVQTHNNIANYSKKLNLEPAVANLPDNPGSDWRYGLVAVKGDAQATGGTVTARYSELKRSSDGNPDVSIQMQTGETQLYLVVAATPTVHHKISWDQFYYTVYRFPYMVEINGAKPEGFQSITNPAGQQHSNGGGFVQTGTSVDATAYVGPNARVLGTAQVKGNARIEGRAVVKGNAQVRDNAVVKDYAMIAGGQIYERATVLDGAAVFSGQVYGDAKIHGAAIIVNSDAKIYGNAQVGGVVLIDAATNLSGTAQLLGDGEVYNITATSGVYYGLVDAGVIGNSQHNLGSVPTEATKPRAMAWYDPSSSSVPASSSSSVRSSSSSSGTVGILAAPIGAQFFKLSNKGIFSYSLGEANSANLKIFDIRGKLLKTIHLSNTHGIVDMQLGTAQVLLWRVELPSGKIIYSHSIVAGGL
jgi:carbonic anhydrase/acetyltransferase-like protein (isoleucine patch superfamily)